MSNAETSPKPKNQLLARLIRVSAKMWTLVNEAGDPVSTILGDKESMVLASARTALVVDRGFPEGTWTRRGEGSYSFVTV